MTKKSALIQALVFLIFIGAFFILHFALPDKEFSEQENRPLQTAPPFSLDALFSGRFTKQAEDYVSDQFPFRDGWTSIKARSELLSGKDGNNGVYLCENGTLLEAYTAPDDAALLEKLDAVNQLTDTAGVPVWFALIPGAADIWSDLLPPGAPNDSQRETIDRAYAYVRAQTVDMYAPLVAHAPEPVYYRTDHHWTTLGAYYGYAALAEAMGFEPVPLTDYTETVVTEEFYGTAYSASGFSWVKPDRISTYVEQGDATVTNYPAGAPRPGTLYDESYLARKDKYGYFYGGNTPRLTVETGNPGPKLLILRDSYMDSLSPYLFAHFSELDILDLRYYRSSIAAHIGETAPDAVLVCYSVADFTEDANIFLMGW